jgi:non-heme chloroperoxidase
MATFLTVSSKPAVATMKVAQISKPGSAFEIIEREIPEPDPGQVRIRVQACGICHSDVLTKDGRIPGIQYPRIPGHEVAGVIDAVGAGFRCIAHDRRGHGRSSQPWEGNEMNTYADDLSTLVEKLDLKNVIHVGHSTGGGEVARYIARHGTKRVAKAVLIGAVPPLMLKTPANSNGTPIEAFDRIRAAVLADRSSFWKELAVPFYGFNRPGARTSHGLIDSFWLQGMQAGHKAVYDCIRAFSETDQTEDLKKFDVPTLILHGDDDQIVPIKASAFLSSKLVKRATLKVIPGAPHGMVSTLKDQINAELLAFFKSSRRPPLSVCRRRLRLRKNRLSPTI